MRQGRKLFYGLRVAPPVRAPASRKDVWVGRKAWPCVDDVERHPRPGETLLAASVAHEIGNPLNALHIHLQLIEREKLDISAISLAQVAGVPEPAP